MRTRSPGSALSRFTSAHPADPPPTTMKSYRVPSHRSPQWSQRLVVAYYETIFLYCNRVQPGCGVRQGQMTELTELIQRGTAWLRAWSGPLPWPPGERHLTTTHPAQEVLDFYLGAVRPLRRSTWPVPPGAGIDRRPGRLRGRLAAGDQWAGWPGEPWADGHHFLNPRRRRPLRRIGALKTRTKLRYQAHGGASAIKLSFLFMHLCR